MGDVEMLKKQWSEISGQLKTIKDGAKARYEQFQETPVEHIAIAATQAPVIAALFTSSSAYVVLFFAVVAVENIYETREALLSSSNDDGKKKKIAGASIAFSALTTLAALSPLPEKIEDLFAADHSQDTAKVEAKVAQAIQKAPLYNF